MRLPPARTTVLPSPLNVPGKPCSRTEVVSVGVPGLGDLNTHLLHAGGGIEVGQAVEFFFIRGDVFVADAQVQGTRGMLRASRPGRSQTSNCP